LNELLLATDNQGKVREYSLLLEGLPFTLVTPGRKGIKLVINESDTTLEDNAALKARTYAQASNLLTLADDSGLEVDALAGEPGPLSARYAGEGASDRKRVEFLLNKISAVPWEKRGARFRCVIAIATPEGKLEFCHGECGGIIAFQPKGENGFGYDPIFYLPELDKTMAELPLEQKNKISHRGKAAQKARQILNRLSGGQN
jgi:XTP/dITP diphosphohydrolase